MIRKIEIFDCQKYDGVNVAKNVKNSAGSHKYFVKIAISQQ